jgi:hypothetical protein
VVLRHAIGASKIACLGARNLTLAEATDWALLCHDGTQWAVLAASTLADGLLTASNTWTGTQTMADGSLVQSVGKGTGTGDVLQRLGGTVTEGLELRCYEDTVAPAAVETNLINLPAGSVVLAVFANVESALTGGGTTATWSIGTAADPDKYGTAGYPTQADSLAKNSKSSWMGTWAFLTSSEQMVLSAAATGGAADGDTALTVGSVRVRVYYYAVNALDDAP